VKQLLVDTFGMKLLRHDIPSSAEMGGDNDAKPARCFPDAHVGGGKLSTKA
jgi:hypothetical protein